MQNIKQSTKIKRNMSKSVKAAVRGGEE